MIRIAVGNEQEHRSSSSCNLDRAATSSKLGEESSPSTGIKNDNTCQDRPLSADCGIVPSRDAPLPVGGSSARDGCTKRRERGEQMRRSVAAFWERTCVVVSALYFLHTLSC